MRNITFIIFLLASLFSQNQIEGRWHLVGYEDLIMYQFEDNYRYSIYSMDGNFGGLEDAGNSPNPYTVEEDIITIDLFFGNIVNYQMNYRCDGQAVEFIDQGIIHSTLFREGCSYIDNNCEEYFNDCETGYTDINGLCFHDGDIEVLQKLIDNSVNSGINDDCDPYDPYCGSPNPYMDQEDAWFWVVVDSTYYQSGTGNGFQNANGQVDPLELGLQEWEDGRLISLMCGAYIYCQLSGPIPEEIGNLSEISVLRLEYNYLSGFIPETICDLNTNNSDYLEFDLTGNYLCPPYPECISTAGFWFQDTSSCSEIGDINFDSIINILDIIVLISFILEENYPDYQEFIISDINLDGFIDVLDVVEILNIILN